jgi:hypothetical protein
VSQHGIAGRDLLGLWYDDIQNRQFFTRKVEHDAGWLCWETKDLKGAHRGMSKDTTGEVRKLQTCCPVIRPRVEADICRAPSLTPGCSVEHVSKICTELHRLPNYVAFLHQLECLMYNRRSSFSLQIILLYCYVILGANSLNLWPRFKYDSV